MSDSDDIDLGQYSLLDLFRIETETQLQTLHEQLLVLERDSGNRSALEACMRAAHSLKGASRMVEIDAGAQITHAMEDLFVAAQEQGLQLDSRHVDLCLAALDLLDAVAQCTQEQLAPWHREHQPQITALVQSLQEAQTPAVPVTDAIPLSSLDKTAAPYTGFVSDESMLALFRMEAESHLGTLEQALQQQGSNDLLLTTLAHVGNAIKSAARLVEIPAAADLAQALETAAGQALDANRALSETQMQAIPQSMELLLQIARLSIEESAAWIAEQTCAIQATITQLTPGQDIAPPPEAAGEASPSSGQIASAEISLTPFSADATMMELFRGEVESHGAALNEGLLNLEHNPADAILLEGLMRASHSIKGAARMVGVDCGVRIAHVMEDVFVAAQTHRLTLNPEQMDVLLRGVDMLTRIAQVSVDASGQWLQEQEQELVQLVQSLQQVLQGETPAKPVGNNLDGDATNPVTTIASHPESTASQPSRDAAIRVSAESLNRLMGLAGEVRVESRWLRPFAEGLVQVKHRQAELINTLDRLGEALNNIQANEYVTSLLSEAQHKAGQCRHNLSDRLNELEEYDRRSHNLADRLNREVVASRMRPFGDGIQGFQRMVRDLARSLDKQVQLEVNGIGTQVDRDILSKMEAPLNHLVRNAIDHGIETPAERRAAGKPELATIVMEAVHSSGMLSITVRDDGRGIDPEQLRRKVVDKGLTNEAMAANLSEAELMEFLFLPGFSTRDQVTEISGRGVGLDVVHSSIQEMRGVVRAISTPGQGLQFQMQLPLTLSVVRALLVEIGGEPYAFPLARIDRTLKMHRDRIETMEGRQYFTLGNQHIGILSANQVLELMEPALNQDELPIIVLGERMDRYGLVVDRFLGERNLVVQTIDPRLGKVQDVSSAAILEDGTPCLIMDVDDLIRSIDILIAGGRLDQLDKKGQAAHHHRGKRVLVVDDSITVREVERNMLVTRGYAVDVAVDGMDGWNAVRTGHYDLVISDVDMPRMNGFEFVEHIKGDPVLKSTPVMIVSYKDREEDRARGLEVGADYYLTKGSFHDETLLDAVMDLIGEA